MAQTNFGDDSIKTGIRSVKKLMEKKGDMIRFAFVTNNVEKADIHYVNIKGIGYRMCLKEDYGYCPMCDIELAAVSKASNGFAVNVFVYDLDKNGEPIVDSKTGMPKGEVYFWNFSSTVFIQLRAKYNLKKSLVGIDFSLIVADIKNNTKIFDISNYDKSESLSADPEVLKYIVERVKKEGYDLRKMIAKRVEIPELVKELGLDPSILNNPKVKRIINLAEEKRALKTTETESEEYVAPKARVNKPQQELPEDEELDLTNLDDAMDRI